MADAFARWIDRLLGDLGLIVFDCSDRAAKPLASGIFAHEVTHPGTTWALAGEAGRRLDGERDITRRSKPRRQPGAALFR